MTDWTKVLVPSGDANVPITELGIEQVKALRSAWIRDNYRQSYALDLAEQAAEATALAICDVIPGHFDAIREQAARVKESFRQHVAEKRRDVDMLDRYIAEASSKKDWVEF